MNRFSLDESQDMPELSEAATSLFNTAMELSDPLFAVIDGAQYGDLPHLLSLLEIDHKSLFLEHADKEIEAASGWLVPMHEKDQLARLLKASDEDCRSLVLWACPLGENSLHRHLRTINFVKIPSDFVSKGGKNPSAKNSEDDIEEESKYESVLFRHYDPNVLASLISVLDSSQLLRIFGPATSILMYAGNYGGLRHTVRSEKFLTAAHGSLRIGSDKMKELQRSIQDFLNVQAVSYLREVAPDETSSMTFHELVSFFNESEKIGEKMGLTVQTSQHYWAYMMITSDSKVATNAVVKNYISKGTGEGTPDERISCLMDELEKLSD